MNNTYSLQELIDAAAAKHRTSVRQMSFTAQKAGHRVTATTLNQIRNGSYKSKPSEETLRAIAWLAGVEAEVAFAAAGQPVPGPPLSDELPPGADNLSPKSRKAVVEMVRVLVDLEAGHHAQHSSDTGTKRQPFRAVAPSGNPGPRQKTSPQGYEAEDALDQHGITQISGPDAGNIPVPPLEQLAAHPNLKSEREKWEEIHGERGEGSQNHDG